MAEHDQPTDLRRIARLFGPYRGRLSAVLALMLLSAGLGMVSPFLLRRVLDHAIPARDTTLLTMLVAGMIGVSIATGALGVAQTWLSNLVGQRVMHDLRSAVYRHLQRLSLAFFTRTRTGEVQSRIANDIGGVQNVVTSTATSIVANVTTVVAVIIAMFALDWELATRFTDESRELADLEVRSRMAGRWRMASVQMSFAVMPALVYWFAGQTSAISIGTVVAFTTLQTRLLFPIQSLLSVGVDVQTSGALFARIFEYLDLPVEVNEGDIT